MIRVLHGTSNSYRCAPNLYQHGRQTRGLSGAYSRWRHAGFYLKVGLRSTVGVTMVARLLLTKRSFLGRESLMNLGTINRMNLFEKVQAREKLSSCAINASSGLILFSVAASRHTSEIWRRQTFGDILTLHIAYSCCRGSSQWGN